MGWKIFADESYDPNGWFVLAGYGACSEQWDLFSSDWGELLPRFGSLDSRTGTYSFHMTEMMNSDERKKNIIYFGRVIERHINFMISIRFWLPDIIRAQERLFIPGFKLLPFAPAEECVRIAWNQMMATCVASRDLISNAISEKEDLEFIFDKNSASAKFLAEWGVSERNYPMLSSSIKTMPRFEDDRILLPLQAADMLAWRVRTACPPSGEKYPLETLRELWQRPKKMQFLDIVLHEDGITDMLLEGTADSVPVSTFIVDRKTGANIRGRAVI